MMASSTVRRVQRVTNKTGQWLIMAGNKKIGDISRNRKDYRIYFYHSGFAFYRKTEKEAIDVALKAENFAAAPKVTAKSAKPAKPAKQVQLPFNTGPTTRPALPPIEPVSSVLLKMSAHGMTLPTVYAAYGMNTSRREMAYRCRTAHAVGRGIIDGWRLEFRGCADIVEEPGAKLEVAVWLIYPNDEAALDRLEGYPVGYIKKYLPVSIIIDPNEPHTWVHTRAMVYVMTDRRRNRATLPSDSYRKMLECGYDEFNLRPEQITEALAAAHRDDDRPEALRADDHNWYYGDNE